MKKENVGVGKALMCKEGTRKNCWHCQKEISLPELFCPHCQKVQPPEDLNHFLRLGIQPQFLIALEHLEQIYFVLQKQLHPDCFTNKSEQEKYFSLQQSMAVNDAYTVLKKPLSRAEYILKLRGIDVNSEEHAVQPSQELLLQSLQDREKLEAITSKTELANMAMVIDTRKKDCLSRVASSLAREHLTDATQYVMELKYLEKLAQEIKQKGE